ncbi:MAG: FAD-dependent oxidoreductase [Actinomycetota bacterium]
MRIIIVGAGLSGLMAAPECVARGHEVIVFDKGRGVGGRLATRRIKDATLDHGAQFFTVRSDEFQTHVNDWITAGVVREWCRGFSEVDGHPRYVGTNGMTSIAKHLAIGLDVRTSTLVFSLTRGETESNSNWVVTTDDGVAHHADCVILTAPIPQSFSLMFGGGIEMPTELRNTDYDRTLGLLVTLDSNDHNVVSPGGMQFPDDVFSFISDNTAKGISAVPALTFHANPEWSLANFDKTNREIHDDLLEAATSWLGTAQVTSSEMKKWRFAIPKKLWPDTCWVDDSGTLAIAGDAFAGPRVEGAALSGLAAARALIA